MKTSKLAFLSAALAVFAAGPLLAIPAASLGTSAPPTSLYGYTVVPFVSDGVPIGSWVTSKALPPSATPSGAVVFDAEVLKWTIGPGVNQFLSWSNGYTGEVFGVDVFLATADFSTITLSLPTDTKAFYFYVQPGPLDLFMFDVTAFAGPDSVSILNTPISGLAGAQGFGFAVDDPTQSLTSVAITGHGTWPDGFAVGQFGINGTIGVPDHASTVLLLVISLLGLAPLRRRIIR